MNLSISAFENRNFIQRIVLTFGSDSGRHFGNITHQYGRHDKSLILQVFNDLSVNVAVASREVDTLGTVPSTDFLQAFFAIQFNDI